MFTNLTNKIREFTPKQMIVAGVFTLALAGSIGLGLANKQSADAQTIRDCSPNSIDNQNRNGGCGALSPSELIKDIKDNKPSDLKSIYADPKVGALTSGKYDRFAKEARHGVIKRNGDVVVDGQVVMRDAWTVGRTKFNGQRESIKLGSKTYYHSHPSNSFASNRSELDVMVMFDKNGTVEVAVMEACGNPITKGKKVKSGAECEALNMKKVSGKENTYSFTTDTSKFGLAKITKVEYFVDGKKFATETNPTKAVQRTFSKSATVTAKVYASVPGKQQIVVEGGKCKKQVTVEAKKEIFAVCKALIATARDNTNRNFRFTVNTDQSEGVTVKSADFTLDGQVTTTGVTDKENGKIYKDYDFTDNVEHTVSAVVHFTHEGKTLTSKEECVAKVTPEQPPVCPHNPQLPPDSPECEAPECPEKPGSGLPPGHPDCVEAPEEVPPSPELPNTGPASLLGLFGGASIAGGAAHKILLRYRSRD